MTNDVCENDVCDELNDFATSMVDDAANAVLYSDPLDYRREIKALALYCPEIVWSQLDVVVESLLSCYDTTTDQKRKAMLIALAKKCNIFFHSDESPGEAILRHWRTPVGDSGLANNIVAHHKAIILKVLLSN